jgi:Protein of unknown function (DUF4242)
VNVAATMRLRLFAARSCVAASVIAAIVGITHHLSQKRRLYGAADLGLRPRPSHQHGVTAMKRYLIERDLPGVGAMSSEQLKGAAATSNDALAKLAGKAQWLESFVADNKTFCIYLADSEASVHEHAKLSGFPATKVTEVVTVITPMTAVS